MKLERKSAPIEEDTGTEKARSTLSVVVKKSFAEDVDSLVPAMRACRYPVTTRSDVLRHILAVGLEATKADVTQALVG